MGALYGDESKANELKYLNILSLFCHFDQIVELCNKNGFMEYDRDTLIHINVFDHLSQGHYSDEVNVQALACTIKKNIEVRKNGVWDPITCPEEAQLCRTFRPYGWVPNDENDTKENTIILLYTNVEGSN